MIYAIMATGKNGEFGLKGDLPWKRNLPTDLRWFKWFTTSVPDAILVCGSETAKSLPPLPGREVITITRTGIHNADWVYQISKLRPVIIIGGAKIIESYLPLIDVIHHTCIDSDFESDVDLNVSFHGGFSSIAETIVKNLDDSGYDVTFTTYAAHRYPDMPATFDTFSDSAGDVHLETNKIDVEIEMTADDCDKLVEYANDAGMSLDAYVNMLLRNKLNELEC